MDLISDWSKVKILLGGHSNYFNLSLADQLLRPNFCGEGMQGRKRHGMKFSVHGCEKNDNIRKIITFLVPMGEKIPLGKRVIITISNNLFSLQFLFHASVFL